MDSTIHNRQLAQLLENEHKLPSPELYVSLAKKVHQKQYLPLLKEGTTIHPTSIKIQGHVMKYYLSRKQPKIAFKHFVKSFRFTRTTDTYYFHKLYADLLVKDGHITKALRVVKNGFEQNEQHMKSVKYAAEFALNHMDWTLAETAFKKLYEQDPNAENLYNLAVCLQIVGKKKLSIHFFNKCKERYSEQYDALFDENGYRKYTIYTNGASSIELYKYCELSHSIVATFDTIDKTIHSIPFAYNVIRRNKMDIVALRRHSLNCFHQDLSRETYEKVVHSLSLTYEKRFAYGTSLGSYCALYFGSLIPEARILAMAPRNSAIQGYGSSNYAHLDNHAHISPHPRFEGNNITIIYDPKDVVDQRYMNGEILDSYPHANICHIPFVGHRIPKYLIQTKQLKKLVECFLMNMHLPAIQLGEKRKQSSEYYWALAGRCFNQKHFTWALKLAERAIHLSPLFDRPHVIRIQSLMSLNRIDEAIAAAHQAIVEFPNQARFTILLSECYLLKNDSDKARSVVEKQMTVNKSKKLETYFDNISH